LQDERLANVEPRMVEMIFNEILTSNQPVAWEQIAGLAFAKQAVQEIVIWPMLQPELFTGLRQPPRGLLLFGPPGTGKTLIGKAIATQAKSTFFNISASSLTSKWIGDGEKMVRALFGVARAMQPSVIFIDEIDSLLTSRGDNEQEASRRIKTEFLLQMDGAAQGDGERLLVIGATNRPQELDEAVRRRMVKRLYIPLPDTASRHSLTQIMLSKPGTQHSLSDADIARIASLTRGYSGADLAALAREAAMVPLRELSRAIGFASTAMGTAVVRPLCVDDFIDALRTTRSSVAEGEITHYREWNTSFGSWAETDEE
jgi:fidgetin-like protein 1